MTTIYLVNEKSDGWGRWRNIGIHRWVKSGDFATNFVDRDEALRKASECGGHVVEFAMGGAKPEPRELDRWEVRYIEIADALGLVNRGEGTDGFEVAPHERIMEAVRDGKRALAESDEMFAELQRLRAERDKPERREPDYWLARLEDGSYRHYGDTKSEFTQSEWAADYGTPVPVYVGEPPPTEREPDGWVEPGSAVILYAGCGKRDPRRHTYAVYIGDPPPAPASEREPDAIMVCYDDGSLDWDCVWRAPLDEETRAWAKGDKSPTRKVYLDTPPPPAPRWLDALYAALGWQGGTAHDAIREVKRLREVLDNREAMESHEVSRLSKTLDEARRDGDASPTMIDLLHENARLQRKLDELAKQPAVAWRGRDRGGPVWVYGELREEAESWEKSGLDVESLYVAPKPATPFAEQAEQIRQEQAGMPEHKRVPSIDHASRTAPADTSDDLTAKFAAWELGEPTPDTPAMVEARRLIAEGWDPVDDDSVRNRIDSSRRMPVGRAVVGAMGTLMIGGGK